MTQFRLLYIYIKKLYITLCVVGVYKECLYRLLCLLLTDRRSFDLHSADVVRISL